MGHLLRLTIKTLLNRIRGGEGEVGEREESGIGGGGDGYGEREGD